MIFKYHSIYQSNALHRHAPDWNSYQLDLLPRCSKGRLIYSSVYRDKLKSRARYEISSQGRLKDFRWAPAQYEAQLNLRSTVNKPYNYKYNRFL